MDSTSEEANTVLPTLLVVLGLAFGPRVSLWCVFRMYPKTW
jgi:hypothetical protein